VRYPEKVTASYRRRSPIAGDDQRVDVSSGLHATDEALVSLRGFARRGDVELDQPQVILVGNVGRADLEH